MNHITLLQEFATRISISDRYIDLKEVEPVEINTRYCIKIKQVAYDNSCSHHIKLTLWNAHVDFFAKMEFTVFKVLT